MINNYTFVINMFYFLGDSFTFGQGIRPPTPDSTSLVNKKHLNTVFDTYLCDNILAGKYGERVEYTNLGQPGGSNRFILDKLLELIPVLTSKDTVIIGTTLPERNYFIFDDQTMPNKVTYLHMNPRTSDSLRKKYNFSKKNIKNPLDTPLLRSTLNFYTDYYSQKVAPVYEYNKFLLQFKTIQSLLHKLNIRVIIWEYTIWVFLENIEHWSKSIIKDRHWSPNGNIYLAKLLDKALDSNVNYIGEEWVEEHIVEVQAESRYIEF